MSFMSGLDGSDVYRLCWRRGSAIMGESFLRMANIDAFVSGMRDEVEEDQGLEILADVGQGR